MNGYRYWVERHTLTLELEREKAAIAALPDEERRERTVAVEAEFRRKLDALYGEIRGEFEQPVAKA